jgi:putative ABC transport system permease protein
MPMIIRIALRNLSEHKVKSLIICGLVAFGMFLLVLSSSVLESAKLGIEKAFVRSFSGHILVGPKGSNGETPNLFPGSFSFDFSAAPTIPKYEEVFQKVQSWKGVAAVSPQLFGMLQLSLPEIWGARMGAFAYNQELYGKMFPDNLSIDQGRALLPDEEGLMLPLKIWNDFRNAAVKEFRADVRAREAEKTQYLSDDDLSKQILAGAFTLLPKEEELIKKATIKVGDLVKLTGFSTALKIKRVPVVGVFHYNAGNSSIDDFAMLDLGTTRYLMGMVVGTTSQIKLDADATSLLDAEFSDDDFFGEDVIGSTVVESSKVDYNDAASLLGDMAETRLLSMPDTGAWHYILVRLENGNDLESTLRGINTWLAAEHPKMMAVNWEVASGQVATLIIGVQLVMMVLILIIAAVSMIIIMNTMVASIIERTGEIGTMRAIGAQKSFVRQVFLSESFILSGVGGFIGLALAGLSVLILNLVGLPIGVELLEMAFGGKVLYPVLSIGSIVLAVLVVLSVGFLSSIYPTYLAMKVSPLKAMQS